MPVKFKGPIFDGTAQWILTDAVENGRREVADEGVQVVREGTRVFRYNSKPPTGRYRNEVHVIHAGWLSKILPGFLPYVRWIEGTSRRNQTTRFKGYHLFQKAALRLEGRVSAIMERHVAEAVRRLNG